MVGFFQVSLTGVLTEDAVYACEQVGIRPQDLYDPKKESIKSDTPSEFVNMRYKNLQKKRVEKMKIIYEMLSKKNKRNAPSKDFNKTMEQFKVGKLSMRSLPYSSSKLGFNTLSPSEADEQTEKLVKMKAKIEQRTLDELLRTELFNKNMAKKEKLVREIVKNKREEIRARS